MSGDEFKAELKRLGLSIKEFCELSGWGYQSIINAISREKITEQMTCIVGLLKKNKELESQIAGLKALLKS